MSVFNFKHFSVNQTNSGLKIGTDAFLLGAFVNYTDANKILDIGTGTGVLALIAAQKSVNSKITGVEIDLVNYELAKMNFATSNWSTRLNAKHLDISLFPHIESFNLIISNPPYFQNSTVSPNNRTSLAKHNPSLSAAVLMNKVGHLLTKNGRFWCILPADHSPDYLMEAERNKLFVKKKILVNGKPSRLRRIIYCFTNTKSECTEEQFTVRDNNGNYTAAYKSLTADLHDREV